MTKKQKDRVVQLLSDGTTLREAASIAQVPWSEFAREWSCSRKEHEDGKATAGSRWYSICQAGRAAYRATLRAKAAEKAGTKASSDSLALLKYLEGEQDPHDDNARPMEINIVSSPEVRELAMQLTVALARVQVERA